MRPNLVVFVLLVLATPAWILASDILRDEAGVAELRLGYAVSGLEDQDGDGDWELLVGAPGYNGTGQDAGRVLLWFGGTGFDLNANLIWDGEGGEQFGHAVARIGDVNGDGSGDFAVGAPFADAAGADAGRVYVFYGGLPLSGSADLVLEGPASGGQFGWSIAALGDLDGDDRDDFAVGAPLTDTAGIEAGAAYVFFGASGGPATTPDLSFAGTLAYERFGWSVAGVAEFLGGQARCLAVGAPSNGVGAGSRQGAVYVFEGSTSPNPGPNTTVDLFLQSNATVLGDNEFGYSVAGIGRFDGDQDPDLIVGAPFCDQGGIERGRAEIFFGGYDADADSDRDATGPASGARFGWSVAGVGDIVGSGAADVIIGAPYDDTPASEAGRAFIWPGGSGDVSDADNLDTVVREGPAAATQAGDHFGTWCAWAGDLDGDGADDYAVGAPDGNVFAGAVAGWVRFVDSSGTAVPVQIGTWSCAWTDDGAVAGRLPIWAPPAAVAEVALIRLDPATGARRELYRGTPDSPVARLDGDLLLVRDQNAAWQGGASAYAVELLFASGVRLTQEPLAGPSGAAPTALAQLRPARPNPFNPATEIGFRAQLGDPVNLDICDLRGRRVRRLLAGVATGTWQTVRWDGRDGRGRSLASGSYLVRLTAAGRVDGTRVTILE